MSNGFDAIIIGSGFGGAVTAYRLAEAGARVLVLERGRRWTPEQYPRQPTDAWLYDHAMPEKLNGWLDMRFFHRIAVIQGAGVGGGSQCYSSVVMRPNRFIFDTGWPPEITFEALEPYFAKVDTMLGVRPGRSHRTNETSRSTEQPMVGCSQQESYAEEQAAWRQR